MADAVEKFDPKPSCTDPEDLQYVLSSYWDPPQTPEAETFGEKLGGMAAWVKKEESFQKDPDLHKIPDAPMLFLWAMKQSPNARVVWP